MGNSEGIDNETSLTSDKAFVLIKKFFAKELSSFGLIQEYNDPRGYWGLKYSKDQVLIFLGYERSFIDFFLKIDGQSVDLSEYDSRIKLLERTSKINLLLVMQLFKEILVRKNLL